jgi:predicted double-glycine peptidase
MNHTLGRFRVLLVALPFVIVSIVGAPLSAHAADPAPRLPSNALPVPLVPQATDYSCGAAALMSVLYYWQVYDGTETDLYARLGTNEKWGTEPEPMAAMAKRLGLRAEIKQKMTLQDLRDHLKDGSTVILDLQAWRILKPHQTPLPWKDNWEDGHYVVLIGMDSLYAYFMDPSAHVGYGYMPIIELLDRWHDYEDRNGPIERSEQLGVVISGTRAHTAFPSALVRME